MNPMEKKKIILGVTGSIAVYKAVDLASKLTQAGAVVTVVMTESAKKFVSPLAFSSVTGQKVLFDMWAEDSHVQYVQLGESADLFLIAPITAGTIAKIATGFTDNLLTLTALTARCPIMIAPAMDGAMYQHPATQDNVEKLTKRGIQNLAPASGRMASGLSGTGRMQETQQIVEEVRFFFSRKGELAGKNIVITAGGTQEPIDPVRFITNRSSGKQGFALAQVALDAGASVTLIVGATAMNLSVPFGARKILTETASQMLEQVLYHCKNADALIMAAAVADFRPSEVAGQKIKKTEDLPTISLEANQDILLKVAEQRASMGFPKIVVGFAAESQNLIENAQSKLKRKSLSMIVANDISQADAGFAVDQNRVILIKPDSKAEELPLLSKKEVAERIVAEVSQMIETANS